MRFIMKISMISLRMKMKYRIPSFLVLIIGKYLNYKYVFKEFVIKNLKECNVTSLDDVFRLIQVGENNRHYAETILNHQSSRSHTVFKVLLSAYMNESEDDEDFTFSTEACINFIDLAGSEKISATPHSDEI